jgi:hypothetical protein
VDSAGPSKEEEVAGAQEVDGGYLVPGGVGKEDAKDGGGEQQQQQQKQQQ